MQSPLALCLILLAFVCVMDATEVNFNFGGMVPSNAVSCDTGECEPSGEEQLISEIEGDILTLDSDPDEYDELTQVWSVPRGPPHIPTVVVVAENEQDVVNAVKYARSNGLEVSIKNGGHAQDGLSLPRRGMQINMKKLNQVILDPRERVALVQGGALAKEVAEAGRAYNLAPVTGNVGVIGFSGQTAVGGYGALSRKAGLGIDNVLSVKLINWEGDVMNVSETSNPDLFWGLKGALSNFGIAVSWQIRLHDVTNWYGGDIVFPAEYMADVIRWANQYSEEENFHFRGLYIAQDGIFLTQWAFWDPGFTQQEKDAFFEPLELVAPVLAWSLGTVDYYQGQSADDAKIQTMAKNVYRAYGVGGGVKKPTDEFLDSFQEQCLGLEMKQGLCRFELWAGNITNRIWADATAFWSRDNEYLWTFEPNWANPEQDGVWIEKAKQARELLRSSYPETNNDCYPNYVSPDFFEMCYGNNIDRLRSLKEEYDPENFFHNNYNIQ